LVALRRTQHTQTQTGAVASTATRQQQARRNRGKRSPGEPAQWSRTPAQEHTPHLSIKMPRSRGKTAWQAHPTRSLTIVPKWRPHREPKTGPCEPRSPSWPGCLRSALCCSAVLAVSCTFYSVFCCRPAPLRCRRLPLWLAACAGCGIQVFALTVWCSRRVPAWYTGARQRELWSHSSLVSRRFGVGRHEVQGGVEAHPLPDTTPLAHRRVLAEV
jgi:hypothetical protein